MSQLSKEEKDRIEKESLSRYRMGTPEENSVYVFQEGAQYENAHLSEQLQKLELENLQNRNKLQSQAKRIEEMTELLRESRSLIDRTQYVIDRLLNKPS